jgi:hypothetical protein
LLDFDQEIYWKWTINETKIAAFMWPKLSQFNIHK